MNWIDYRELDKTTSAMYTVYCICRLQTLQAQPSNGLIASNWPVSSVYRPASDMQCIHVLSGLKRRQLLTYKSAPLCLTLCLHGGCFAGQAIAQVGSKQWNLTYDLCKGRLQASWVAVSQSHYPTSLMERADPWPRELNQINPRSLRCSFGNPIMRLRTEPWWYCLWLSLRWPTSSFELRGRSASPNQMDFTSRELQNGSFDVPKVLYLTQPISLQTAKALCSGNAFVPVFRPGPRNSKKAIQWLLSRLGGYQVRWHALQEKTAAEAQSLGLGRTRPSGTQQPMS